MAKILLCCGTQPCLAGGFVLECPVAARLRHTHDCTDVLEISARGLRAA